MLWLLGLPTGAIIIVLNRWIPESPRFLSNAGLEDQAQAVLRRFAGPGSAAIEEDSPREAAAHSVAARVVQGGMRALLRGKHAAISYGLLVCGVAWGLANFGFLLWLPSNLTELGVDPEAASALLARSAVLALPGIAVVVWLYHRWSSIRALVAFVALTALCLSAFCAMDWLQLRSQTATVAATAALLIGVSGVIAMLIPYAAEIYPVHLRATGSGLIAASSKLGGILGAVLGVFGFFDHFALSALLIASTLAISAVMLWRAGIETRGRSLEEIETALG